jgi:hypothetical protein
MQSLAYNFWNNKKGQFLSFSDYTASYDPPNLENAQIFKNHFDNLITNTNFIYENIIPLLKFNGVSFIFIYHFSVQIGIFIVFDNGSLPESAQAELEQAELEQQELSTSVSKKRARSDQGRSDVYQGRLQIKRSRLNPNTIIPESKAFFFQNSNTYPFQSPSFLQKIKSFFFQNTNTFAYLNVFLQKILDSISSTNIILIDFNSISSLQSFTDTLKQSAMHSPFFIPLVPQSTSIDPTNITELLNHNKRYDTILQKEPAFTTKYFIYTQFFKDRFGNSVQNLLQTDFLNFNIPRIFEKKYELIIFENSYLLKNYTLASANINTKIFDDNVRYIYVFINFLYSDIFSAHSFSILIDKFNKTFLTIDSTKRTDTNTILRLVSSLSIELTNLLINYSCLDFITELEKYSSVPVVYFQDYSAFIEASRKSNLKYIVNFFVNCKELLKNYLSDREKLLILNYTLPLDSKLNLSYALNNLFLKFISDLKQYETTSINQYKTYVNNSSYSTDTPFKLTKIIDKFIFLLNSVRMQIDLDVIEKKDYSELLKSLKLDEESFEKIYSDLISKKQKKLLLIQDNDLDEYCVLWTFILLFYMFKLYELNLNALQYIAENINNLGIGFIIDIFKIFDLLNYNILKIISTGHENNISPDIVRTDIVNATRQVLTLTNYNDSHANTSIFGSDCALIN